MSVIKADKDKIKSDDIDLIELFEKVKKGRKIIYKVLIVFFAFGLLVGLGTPNSYKSEAKLLIESRTKNSGMSGALQQFSSMAGINLKSSDDALTPELYPEVVKNIPFLLEVLNYKIRESKYDSTLTVSEYLERYPRQPFTTIIKNYTIGLPFKVINWFKSKPYHKQNLRDSINGVFYISEVQSALTGVLSKCVTAEMGTGKLSNVLIISTETQDPLVATQLNNIVVDCLQKYIIEYRTQKAKSDLNFIAERQYEAEKKYVMALQSLSAYRDQNRNVILASSKTIEDRLQGEYNLAFSLYNSLSQQLEQAKITVQENTPVFKVMEPATIPLNRNKPQVKIILFVSLFLGFAVGVSLVFIKDFLQKLHSSNNVTAIKLDK